MREWVNSFLIRELPKKYDKEQKEGKQSPEYLEGLEILISMLREGDCDSKTKMFLLTQFLRYSFIEDDNQRKNAQRFITIFGSVLADLPRKVYEKVIRMKNLWFFYHLPNRLGTVYFPKLESNLKRGGVLKIVVFPSFLITLPMQALRGVFAHELAHVHLGLGNSKGREEEADATAIKWGFKNEIQALKRSGDRYVLKMNAPILQAMMKRTSKETKLLKPPEGDSSADDC